MISVIVPVYNVADYLEECLESLLNQSYKDLEIIAVNDGSTDNSGEICEQYAKKDPRIRIIVQKNQGLSAARNTGLDAMAGDYVAFLDSDDYLMPSALEHMLSLAKAHEADMVVCPFLRLDPDGSCTPYKNHAPIHGTEVFDGAQKMASYIAMHKQTNTVCGKLYTRELFQQFRFPIGKVAEDVFVSYQVIHAAKRIVIDEKPQYVYRNRPESIMTRSTNIRDYDVIEGRTLEAAFVAQHYPELRDKVFAKLCNAAVVLTFSTALDRFSDSKGDKILKTTIRKNLRYYLKSKYNLKRKAIAVLAPCSLTLTRCFIRLLRKA